MNRRPPCMEDVEWAGWEGLNQLCTTTRASSPCIDCTTDFAATMRAQGRCDSQPGAALRYTRVGSWAEIILDLHRQGYQQGVIATIVGVSRSTVWEHIHGRLDGAGERRRRLAQERRQAVVRLSRAGVRVVDIARQVGVSESYVRRHRVRAA